MRKFTAYFRAKISSMRILISILLLINLILFVIGVYLQYATHDLLYEKIMGFGVLWMVFILMPVFLYHRYKNKKLKDFQFKKENKQEE